MKFLILCILALSCAEVYGNRWKQLWSTYKAIHRKQYENSTVEKNRFDIFLKNDELFRKHNEDFKAGKVSFTVGHNKYTDLTHDEARKYLLTLKETVPKGLQGPGHHYVNVTSLRGASVPDKVDWVEAGAVTSVKDQDLCGACYAFSVVGALEGMMRIQYKRPLMELSVQNIIDCSQSYGNNGCSGGSRTYVYKYVKTEGGINTEADYPYEGPPNGCKFKKGSAVGKIKYHGEIPKGDEKALKAIVASTGPVSVGIDASPLTFWGYTGGVYYDASCNPNNLNHAVLVVGYGTEDGEDYWLIKNSWGPNWGLNGYMKLARNRKNHCGVASIANYPLRL